jgi:hypothetical protein
VELASHALASNFIFSEIDKAYKLPGYLLDRAVYAEDRYKWHDTCSICGNWYVDGAIGLDGSEWYMLYGNDAIPIWRGLCSWRCVQKWDIQCDEMVASNSDTSAN